MYASPGSRNLVGGYDSDEEPVHDAKSEYPAARRHGCTDVPCFVLFMVCLAGMVWTQLRAHESGDLRRLTRPMDFNGNLCGVGATVLDKRYLFFCPKHDAVTRQGKRWEHFGQELGAMPSALETEFPICVRSCPLDNTQPVDCTYVEADSAVTSSTDKVKQRTKQFFSYSTSAFMHQYCLPADTALTHELFRKSSLGRGTTQALEALGGIRSSAGVLAAVFLMAVVLSLAYFWLVQRLAGVIIFVLLLGGIVLTLGFGVWCFVSAEEANPLAWSGTEAPGTAVEMGAGALVVGGLLVAFVLCKWQSLRAAIGCVECAAEMIVEMPSVLVIPLAQALFQLVGFLLCVWGVLWIASLGTLKQDTFKFNGLEVQGLTKSFHFENDHLCLLALWALGSFWVLNFLSGLTVYMVAHMGSEWYFTELCDGEKDPAPGFLHLLQGVWRAILYHTGTLAFGSLVGPLFAPVSGLCLLVDGCCDPRRRRPDCPPVVACLLSCMSGLKNFLEPLNKLAFIDTAVRSNGFLKAAHEYFKTIFAEGPAFLAVMGASSLFSLAGTLFVVGISTFVCHYTITTRPSFTMDTSAYYIANPFNVTFCAGLLTGVVSLGIMSILDYAADTALYCYVLDLNTYGRGNRKYCPEYLRSHLYDGAEMQGYASD